jgi:hypothetical protein
MRKDVHKNRRLLILTIVFVNAFASSVGSSHSLLEDCPKITIDCPTEVPESGKTYAVHVRVEGGDSNRKLTYNWSVSSGEIVEGQGTARVKIRITDSGKDVTATVEVGGLNGDCNRVASCSFVMS